MAADMDHDEVLDIRHGADLDLEELAAHDRVGPQRGVATDPDLAVDERGRMDEGRRVEHDVGAEVARVVLVHAVPWGKERHWSS